MRMQILGSGSAGNAALVRAGELSLLIDAGLPIDELERRLAEARMPPNRLDAIVLTHGHLDHARSAGLLSKKTGARVFCSDSLMSNASLRGTRSFHALAIGRSLTVRSRVGIDELELTSIPIPHDADPTVALRLEHGGRRLAYCTDMGHPERTVGEALSGAHVLVLEFNHEAALLAAGPYSPSLKRRVGGPRGHLSNEEAAQVLAWAAGPELHTLVLAHLSATNNRPERALLHARAALVEREAVHVLVAEQDRIGPSIEV